MRALTHFEKCLEVNEAIGCADGIATVKANVAFAKLKYEGINNNEELLESSRELYELRIAELGEEDHLTILAGTNYAFASRMQTVGMSVIEVASTSKQVLGPHHCTTKEVIWHSNRS